MRMMVMSLVILVVLLVVLVWLVLGLVMLLMCGGPLATPGGPRPQGVVQDRRAGSDGVQPRVAEEVVLVHASKQDAAGLVPIRAPTMVRGLTPFRTCAPSLRKCTILVRRLP